MRPRASRVTHRIGIGGALVLAVFVTGHWGAIRDHAAGWHLILTETTRVIPPRMPRPLEALTLETTDTVVGFGPFNVERAVVIRDVLESLATHADRPVLSAPERAAESSVVVLRTRRDEEDVEALERYGWRVTTLQLPRVVIAYPP